MAEQDFPRADGPGAGPGAAPQPACAPSGKTRAPRTPKPDPAPGIGAATGAATGAPAKGGRGARPPAEGPGRRLRGFEPAGRILAKRIRAASESRGFAVARLLTHWPEIVGAEIARIARPVKIGYARQGFGASLTLLTTGAAAPRLQMEAERIRERVNACYGYNAISRVVLTQTAASGLAEPPRPRPAAPAAPDAETRVAAAAAASAVRDPGLRAALEGLAAAVLAKARANSSPGAPAPDLPGQAAPDTKG